MPGASNGSDALTKPGGTSHQKILLEDMGLCQTLGSQKADDVVKCLLDGLGHMSHQNRRRMEQGLGRLARSLLETCGVEHSRIDLVNLCLKLETENDRPNAVACSETVSETCHGGVSSSETCHVDGSDVEGLEPTVDSEQSVDESSPTKWVTFQLEPQVFAVQSRKLPRRWNRFCSSTLSLNSFVSSWR